MDRDVDLNPDLDPDVDVDVANKAEKIADQGITRVTKCSQPCNQLILQKSEDRSVKKVISNRQRGYQHSAPSTVFKSTDSFNSGPFDSNHQPFFMKIASIQFGLLSSEEIQKMSVCTVTQSKIPTQSDVRCHGTVYDARMGTTNVRSFCQTCRKNIWNCPGHFGVINFSKKIFHPLFSSYLVQTLRCFCFYCYRPLVSQRDLDAKETPNFEELVAKLKRLKKLICPHCGHFQVDFKATQSDLSSSHLLFKFHAKTGLKQHHSVITLEPAADDDTPHHDENRGLQHTSASQTNKLGWLPLYVDQVDDIVTRWSDQDLISIGIDPTKSHPRCAIMTCMPVLPICGRTFVVSSEMQVCDDDLTYQYCEIVKSNNSLAAIARWKEEMTQSQEISHCGTDDGRRRRRKRRRKGSSRKNSSDDSSSDEGSSASDKKTQKRTLKMAQNQHEKSSLLSKTAAARGIMKKNSVVGAVEASSSICSFQERKAYCNLVFRSQTALDNTGNRARHAISGKAIMGLKERMTGKKGIVRENCVGKRTNQSGRSVVGPDPTLDLHEIGVPLLMAQVLTFTECVCPVNKAELQRAVENGECEFVIKSNGKKINLKIAKQLNFGEIQLQFGDKVLRHLRDGDWVMLNRQPTLHRGSMYGMKAKILPIYVKTLKINLALTESFNLDFDGDEMNIFPPQSYETKAEIMNLSSPLQSMTSQQNGNPFATIVQDSLLGTYLMTFHCNNVQTLNSDLWNNIWFSIVWKDFLKKPKVGRDDESWASCDMPNTIKRMRSAWKSWTEIGVWDYLRHLSVKLSDDVWNSGIEVDGLVSITNLNDGLETGPLIEISDSSYSRGPNISVERFIFQKEWLNDDFPNRPILKFRPLTHLNGRGLLCASFPVKLTTFHSDFVIYKGLFVHGILTKKRLGRSCSSLTKIICDAFGNKACAEFVNKLQRAANEFMRFHGFSISPSDCKIPEEHQLFIDDCAAKTLMQMKMECSSASQFVSEHGLKERYIINIINRSTENLKIQTFKVLPHDNGFMRTCFSGSKGDTFNIMQIMCSLGQQYIEGCRIHPTMTKKTRTSPFMPFSHHRVDLGEIRGELNSKIATSADDNEMNYDDRRNDDSRVAEAAAAPAAAAVSVHPASEDAPAVFPSAAFADNNNDDLISKGFIKSSFMNGLNFIEFFAHSCSGRTGIIDSSTMTSMSGYTFRQVSKTMEDIYVTYDRVICDHFGHVILPNFGHLGFDPAKGFFDSIPVLVQNVL